MKTKDHYYQIHTDRYRFLLSEIKKLNLSKPGKILDIGCYPPFLFDNLNGQGFDVYGISSPHEKFDHSKVKILNLEQKKLPFKENSFDLIIFSEVLEHLASNIEFVLKEINRVLKPGKFLILTTPNVVRSQNILSLFLGKNIYFPLNQLDDNIYFRHNREYTLPEVKLLLQNTKHQILHTKHFIAYTPFREKNRQDPFFLKVIKYTNYLLMCLFRSRQDTLYFLATKN